MCDGEIYDTSIVNGRLPGRGDQVLPFGTYRIVLSSWSNARKEDIIVVLQMYRNITKYHR